MLVADAEALAGLPDSHAAQWFGQCGDERKSGIPLLGQCRCKIPGLHHGDVVLVAPYGCNPLQMLGLEIVVEEMAKQHADTETDGILMFGRHPSADVRQQIRVVLGKTSWR